MEGWLYARMDWHDYFHFTLSDDSDNGEIEVLKPKRRNDDGDSSEEDEEQDDIAMIYYLRIKLSY